MIKLFLALLFNIPMVFSAIGQKPAPVNYTKGYFRYPLAITPRLNANFGEMRPNHFHMGLDLYTLRKENLPIYAAADGYISRVKIEAGGFGNAIVINHPNGLSTLYAHMNDFMAPLDEYVKDQQYEHESWAADLNIPAVMFPVKKGDIIGYSGNTGGSQGPHVHFEIRETATDICLNPLLFGFNIPDNVPPDMFKLAIYNRNISSYEQFPLIIPVLKSGQGYTAPPVIISFDKVIIAIQSTDRMTGVPNSNGIFQAILYENEKAIGGFRINRIGYDQTRYLNAHIDYKTKLSGGAYFQYLFPLPGDKLDIYPYSTPGSFISLKDTAVHHYRLEIKDAYGNTSKMQFSLQRSVGNGKLTGNGQVDDKVEGNVTGKGKAAGNRVGSNTEGGVLMKPGELNVFDSPEMEVYLPEQVLYDSIYFNSSASPGGQPLSFSPEYTIHTPQTPLHDYFILRIKPGRTIPYPLRDKIIIRQVSQDDIFVRKASWEMGMYMAKFRAFGIFQLVADDQPPLLSGLSQGANLSKASRITIYAKDNFEAVKNFRAELDGKWLRFSQRGNTFTYKFDERCGKGEHELRISIDDEAGNRTTQSIRFNR